MGVPEMLGSAFVISTAEREEGLKRPLLTVGLALCIGLVLFGLSLTTTRTPWGAVNGYPLTINHFVASCPAPNPFNGCGLTYDPFIIVLDFIFWSTVALIPAFLLTLILIPKGSGRMNPP